MYFKTRESCREAVKHVNSVMGGKVFKSPTSKHIEGWKAKFTVGTLYLPRQSLKLLRNKPKIVLMFDEYGAIILVSYKKQHKYTLTK